MHPSSEDNEPILVVGKMKINLADGERDHFFRLTNILFENTETIDHPLTYSCSESIQSSGEFVWNEEWVSKASLDNHLASTHFQVSIHFSVMRPCGIAQMMRTTMRMHLKIQRPAPRASRGGSEEVPRTYIVSFAKGGFQRRQLKAPQTKVLVRYDNKHLADESFKNIKKHTSRHNLRYNDHAFNIRDNLRKEW